MECICERMLDTGFTGNEKSDAWLTAKYEAGELDPGFFAAAYRFDSTSYVVRTDGEDRKGNIDASWGRDKRVPGFWDPDLLSKLALKTFASIEENCPARIHYPEQELRYRETLTSSDKAKQNEDREAWEAMELAASHYAVRPERKWSANTANDLIGEASTTDVLTYQKFAKNVKSRLWIKRMKQTTREHGERTMYLVHQGIGGRVTTVYKSASYAEAKGYLDQHS